MILKFFIEKKKNIFCSESRKYHVLKDIFKVTIVKKILKEEKNI